MESSNFNLGNPLFVARRIINDVVCRTDPDIVHVTYCPLLEFLYNIFIFKI